MTHEITEDHRVLTRGDTGDVIATTSWPTGEAARAYARRISETVGGGIRDHSCGGCGPVPSANRCGFCRRLDIREDRAIEAQS